MRIAAIIGSLILAAAWPGTALAGGNGELEHISQLFLWMAVILLAARFACLVERIGQPAVLGELVIGIVLGNLALIGLPLFEPIKSDKVIAFLAELGVVVLLFQIGLESSVQSMMKVGWRAFLVACIGVVAPFVLGTWVVGPWLLPGLSFEAYLFLGATLTATSVGITGRVFRDMGRLQMREAQIVLGAAVIDDVLGLMILAVVSAIVSTGSFDVLAIGWIVVKAFLFLAGSLVLGQLLAPHISRLFARIHTGTGMKLTVALSFCLVFAFTAHQIDLAPIVGAFAAGLILDQVYFRDFDGPEMVRDVHAAMEGLNARDHQRLRAVLARHEEKHVETLLEPIGHLLVPFFFVLSGMQVKMELLADPNTLGVAIALTVAAIAGKVMAGLPAGKVDRWLVGWGMVPRGEVGLIFAVVGKSLGVVSDQVFSVIVLMVILTTLLTPPILAHLLRGEVAVSKG